MVPPAEQGAKRITYRRITQRTASWSPLAPGQILAQPAVRPIVPHGGYHCDGSKRAVVWGNDSALRGRFVLIEAQTTEAVYEGELVSRGPHPWGGGNLLAEFTEFRRPGRYRIRLDIEGCRWTNESVIFAIAPQTYSDLAGFTSRWFYYQRCGTEVPGWHGPCHMDDGIRDGVFQEATGGWHDAGDYNKWAHYAHMGIFALILAQGLFDDMGLDSSGVSSWARELGPGKDFPDDGWSFLEEASWEADFICKVQAEDGTISSVTGASEDPWYWVGSPEKEPQRWCSPQYGDKSPGIIALTGASIAWLGRVLAEKGAPRETVERYVRAGRRALVRAVHWDFGQGGLPPGPEGGRRPEPGAEPDKGQPEAYLGTLAGIAIGALELGELSRREGLEEGEDLRPVAERAVEGILSQQDEQGLFHLDPGRQMPFRRGGYHLLALERFWSLNAGHVLEARLRDSVVRAASLLAPLCGGSPFQQLGGQGEAGKLRNLFRDPCSIPYGEASWLFATAALILKDRGYLELAERQLQWIAGFNPLEVSMIAGVGWGPGCYHTRFIACPGHEDGLVPVGALNGLCGADGTTFNIEDPRAGELVGGIRRYGRRAQRRFARLRRTRLGGRSCLSRARPTGLITSYAVIDIFRQSTLRFLY